ncbi:50S ribosomal protein L21 [Patescibacteria group bacterium]|nr:50S ribosomal protein L21 [Patescibacteria group bacterium]MBU1472807.1 50S ribosomal protein L21 [Patescibacteria group bacterium]MBU2460385.1 50S ribosomal protein L21 [Patescibacteria group bacterium]MBU2544037.1 50S ribosomal protein L21 [Patescibacteria group bacterium]
MFAVIRISGKQYKVSVGDTIEVDHLDGDVGQEIPLESVLLYVGKDNKAKVGKPTVKNTKAVVKIIEQKKGKKIDVLRFKAKSRYRKLRGFRPMLTKIEIVSIS